MKSKWEIEVIEIDSKTLKIQITASEKHLSFREVFDLWQFNDSFIETYCSFIQNTAFKEFYWEHPPLTKTTLDEPYEFILRQSKTLARKEVDTESFKEYIFSEQDVTLFENKGKTTKLIVPTKKGDVENYKHLGIFIRNSESSQINSVFKLIGKTILSELSEKTIWLNTAGLGVIWLHIRLDIRPKYYKYKPYKEKTLV